MSDSRRVRLYHQLRTAHLERARDLPPATIVYAGRRYDFDEDLARQLDLVPVRRLGALRWFLTHDVGTLEVNEPLYRASLRLTACALLGLAVRHRVRRRPRPVVVTYAIENRDPALDAVPPSVRGRLGRRLDARLAGAVWRRVDRIVFGTSSAARLYERVLAGRAELAACTIPALPAAAPEASADAKVPGSVLFLGALDHRKGVSVVLEGWEHVRSVVPDARLLVLGKGPLEDLVRAASAADGSVTLEVDPPRERIRRALQEHQVLVLPSQPSPTWREQVGLPIVEALAHGCTVVGSAETGLADWLRVHGHHVVEPATSSAATAAGVVDALTRPLPVGDVLASLPAQDGRLAADAWLFEGSGAPTAGRTGTVADGD